MQPPGAVGDGDALSFKLKLMNAAGIVLPLAAVFCAIGMLWGALRRNGRDRHLAVGYC